MIYIILSIFLGLIMIIMAFIAIYHKNSVVAIIAVGALGLFASVLYLVLGAPDVAMTEAAIGSGLSTILYFYVFNKIRSMNEEKNNNIKSQE